MAAPLGKLHLCMCCPVVCQPEDAHVLSYFQLLRAICQFVSVAVALLQVSDAAQVPGPIPAQPRPARDDVSCFQLMLESAH